MYIRIRLQNYKQVFSQSNNNLISVNATLCIDLIVCTVFVQEVEVMTGILKKFKVSHSVYLLVLRRVIPF